MATAALTYARNARQDRTAVWAWRTYLASIFLSFFVMVEPAPSDLVFTVGLMFLAFSRLENIRFLHGFAVTGIILYLVFSVNSLFFVDYNLFGAIRAVLIEFYMIGIFVVTAYYCATKGDHAFYWILMMLTLGAVISAFIGFAAVADLLPSSDVFFRGEGVKNRLKSTFKDPNVFGPFLVPSILFTAWLMVSSKKFLWFGMCAFGCLITACILTLSRGAMAHAGASLFILMLILLVYTKSAKPTFLALMATLILGLLTFVLFSDQIVARLEGSLFAERLALQSYDDSRFSHVADATTHIMDHPFGIGPVQARPKYGYLPHNTFVAFALHNGILASIGLFLIYISAMLRCASKVLDQREGWTKYGFLFAVLAGLIVLMQVVGAIHWRHLYVVCGMAFGIYLTDAPTKLGNVFNAKITNRRKTLTKRIIELAMPSDNDLK